MSEIDQGIEILTGVPAGKQAEDGSYPEGTINYLVNERLKAMVEHMRHLSRLETRQTDAKMIEAKGETEGGA